MWVHDEIDTGHGYHKQVVDPDIDPSALFVLHARKALSGEPTFPKEWHADRELRDYWQLMADIMAMTADLLSWPPE
jgi:hypothetical protein